MNLIQLDEEAIFQVARNIEIREVRSAYLDQVCGTDRGLRDRLEALLSVYEREKSFLESPPRNSDGSATVDVPPRAEGPGTVIGPYKLLEQIGEGGMGIVYMAEQIKPVRRKVALKIIKPGMDTKQVIARFDAERQALAMMEHPNIARVLDAGTTESRRPFFVMELVKGIPITDYCDRNRLPIEDRLELFVLVCQALQHAHQKGVIHRDLKPSNVLVTMIDGAAAPKIIDFGVAKAMGQQLTERTLYTGFAQLIGTPLYMSPEQAEFSGVDVDTRSDIYALGVLLYELLTGTTPFDADTFRTAAYDEIRRIIREQEPPKPSTRISTLAASATTVSASRKCDPVSLRKLIRGELDWIVMKALEKDRNRRYETASGLAADVRRYLDDEPVQACPPSVWYRVRKFASRNRRSLATTAVVLVSGLVIGCVLLSVQLQNVSRVREIGQEVRQALVGARTAIEARDLTLASQRVAEAQGRLGSDAASLPALDAEIGGIRREIEARQADAACFAQLLKEASDVQDKMSYGFELGGPDGLQSGRRAAEEVLGLYGILTDKDWLSRLESCYLTADQKQQVRETAYVTLVSLADYLVRWPGLREDPKSVSRSLDLLQLAQAFHQPTRALYFVRARCRRAQGDTSAAAEDEKQFKAAVARTAWDYFLPGHTAGWSGDLDEAVRSYRAALTLQPNHYNSLFFLALRFATKLKRVPEAIQLFTACIALRPDHWITYCNRGLCYRDLGQWDDAITDLRQAGRLRPDDYRPHVGLCLALVQKGRVDEAIAECREAVRLRPDMAWIHNKLAWTLTRFHNAKVRDPAEAVEHARRAVELAPQQAYSLNTLGVAHYRAEDWKAAIEALEKAEALEPDTNFAFNGFFLAMAHWKLGHNDEARAWYDRAVAWMAKNKSRNVELIGFRAEAVALLGLTELPADVFARPEAAR
jgi:serine/threonine protein kinase/tetratricopeptide (TPR) repeat protein